MATGSCSLKARQPTELVAARLDIDSNRIYRGHKPVDADIGWAEALVSDEQESTRSIKAPTGRGDSRPYVWKEWGGGHWRDGAVGRYVEDSDLAKGPKDCDQEPAARMDHQPIHKAEKAAREGGWGPQNATTSHWECHDVTGSRPSKEERTGRVNGNRPRVDLTRGQGERRAWHEGQAPIRVNTEDADIV